MKHYKIEIDVLEVVHDFYPGLSVEDASKIADSIVDAWDYTHDFDSINDDISWYADAHGIEIEGKDGYEIETDNRIIPILRFQSTYELCPENISTLEKLFQNEK